MSKVNPQALQNFFQKKWVNKLCPSCGNTNWNGSDQIYGLPSFVNGKLSAKGPVFPIITANCKNCGYTMIFNAVNAGLVQPIQQVSTPKNLSF